MPEELQLINERVLKGQRRALPKAPPGAESASRTDEKHLIRTVADLIKHGDAQEVCDTIRSRLRQAADVRWSFEEEWYFAVRAWFQQFTEEKEDSWESQRYMPIILKQVETALPAIVSSVLDDNGIFRLVGKRRDHKNAAKALECLINDQATTHDYDEAYERMFWWAVLMGTGYLDHGWDRRSEERAVPYVKDVETDEYHPDGKAKDFRFEEVTYADEPFVEALNPLDIYPAPSATVGDDADWFVQRVETTIGDLRDLAEPQDGEDVPSHMDGPVLEKWIEEGNPASQSEGDESWFDEIAAGATWSDWLSEIGYEREATEGGDDDMLTAERRVVVLVYRSKHETITMAGPNHVIGYSRNINLHGKTGLVIHHFFEIPGCPFGRGIGGILRGHQELGNENINHLMDTQKIEMMAPIVVDKSRANLLDDDLVLQPNAIIRTRGTDAVKRMELPAPTNLGLTMDSHLGSDADDLTGFNAQMRGGSPGGGQTATAFTGLQSNIRTRLIMHVKRSGRTLKRSGRLLASLNQQYYTKTQIVMRTGDDGLEYVEIQPHEIVGNVGVSVSISTSRAAPEMRAQKLMQIFQIAVPVLQGGLLQQAQVRRLFRMLLEANDVEDVDLLIPAGGERIKDASQENILLARLQPLEVNPGEPHDTHVSIHTELLRQLSSEGADPQIIEHITAHIAKHSEHQAAAAQAEQQAAAGQGAQAQQAQGASGAGIGPGGGSETQQGANLASAATGGQGTPGVGAPGPSAPGRQV
jgi:hypothetical protein